MYNYTCKSCAGAVCFNSLRSWLFNFCDQEALKMCSQLTHSKSSLILEYALQFIHWFQFDSLTEWHMRLCCSFLVCTCSFVKIRHDKYRNRLIVWSFKGDTNSFSSSCQNRWLVEFIWNGYDKHFKIKVALFLTLTTRISMIVTSTWHLYEGQRQWDDIWIYIYRQWYKKKQSPPKLKCLRWRAMYRHVA